MGIADRVRWLLLIHQLPKEPAYVRVKIGRRLARVGAIALKNSVYVLPKNESTTEDFQWVRREVLQAGGDATVVDAQLLEGISDEDVEAKFRAAKDAEYAELAQEARQLATRTFGRRKRALSDDERASLRAELERLERSVSEIGETDFFKASGRDVVTGIVDDLQRKANPGATSARAASSTLQVKRRTWVTRTGVHVDRIASAWLIRRFIDPEASFKFVPAKGYAKNDGELRFDMFEAEFSHEGNNCTFETLIARFAIQKAGLGAIAEIVHDIDLKDEKFCRPETAGVAACIAGICKATRDDEQRIAQGSALLGGLLAHFASKAEAHA